MSDDDTDWYALSNGLSVVTECGTLIRGDEEEEAKMTAMCMDDECNPKKPAKWQVGATLWCEGMEKKPEYANPMFTELVVCDECRARVTIERVMPEGKPRERIAYSFGRMGVPLPPDFDKVELTFTEIKHGEPMNLRQMQSNLAAVVGKPVTKLN